MTTTTTTPTTEEQARMIHEALCEIASRCDGARAQDGVGFNGSDTAFGRRVAATPFDEWTPAMLAEVARIIGTTYRTQVMNYVAFDPATLPIVLDVLDAGTNYTGRSDARAAERRRTAQSRRRATVSGARVVFDFPFDGEIKDSLKADGCRFDGSTKTWWIKTDGLHAGIVTTVLGAGFSCTDEVADLFALAATITERPVEATGTVVLVSNDTVQVTLTGSLSRDDFAIYRTLTGYRWERGTSVSTATATEANLIWLEAHGFTGIPEVRSALVTVVAEPEVAQPEPVTITPVDLDAVVPAGLTPYPFQSEGVAFALASRRCFLADEMGLGKTVQAILASRAAGTTPTIVVCPASLKGNWEREINVWSPGATVSVLSGRTVRPASLRAEWIVVNYDLLSAWSEALVALNAQALVIDESHYAKNPKAQRTTALIDIAASIPQAGLVLALTGTPILNRPIELLTQLTILGRLGDIVPHARSNSLRDRSWAFKFDFCDAVKTRFGWQFNGSTNADVLHARLTNGVMIRRLRNDVLDMSDTVRTQVALDLNGALSTYRSAEKDTIAWIGENLGRDAVDAARRAEVLVRLNLLRRLAEEAKVSATIEWVNNWLESFPEKKVVVFAGHVSVQQALQQAFDCPSIMGGQQDVEANKARFQNGDARVIVCSLQAAREGHTLTAASDVVFTSLGWTPGGLQQAEDRCNRIGQTADRVVAWQLNAEGTIDERIASLIASKRLTFDAVINGQDGDDEGSIVDGVIDWLATK